MSNGNDGKGRLVIGLGELHVTSRTDLVLSCIGLGSCIAVCAYDPVRKIAGIGHMVLPSWREGKQRERGPRFVDCGIPLLIERMEALGAARSRVIVKIVGGSQMVSVEDGTGIFDIGRRNVESARITLAEMGIRLRAADVGGSFGRTVNFLPDTGKVVVTTVAEGSREL